MTEQRQQSFAERVRAQFEARGQGTTGGTGARPGGFGAFKPEKPKERTKKLVQRTTSFDRGNWAQGRKARSIDTFINDLDTGDAYKGGERQPFDPAPELVEGLFHVFNKMNSQLTPKRELERSHFPGRKVLEEMVDNPALVELQEKTVGNTFMSTMAVAAMQDTVYEILTRVGNTPAPDAPNPGQGGGPPDPNAPPQQGGGGQGQPDPNAPPDPNAQPGQGGQGGQGQPDPNGQQDSQDGQGGQGQPEIDPIDPDGDLPSSTDEADGQGGGGAGDGDGDGEQEDLTDGAGQEFDPEQAARDAEQAEKDWEDEYDKRLDELDMERLVNKALEQAQNEVDEIDNLRKGIGCEDGDWHAMSPEQQLALAERLRSPEMKALADMVGRMRRFAMGIKQTRINDVPTEPYDVTTGSKLLDVLKTQFAFLGHELGRYEFYRKYATNELLVYKKRGTEEVGKGPIVVCIDKSGSMSGRPFHWAMGAAEALRRYALVDDRDYFAMFFGTNRQRERWDFPKGKADFEKVLAFLGSNADGGTEFDGVLTEALQRASTQFDDDGRGKADIVFITDGQSNLSPQWIEQFNAERQRVGVRVYSIYIGGARDMSAKDGPVGLLNKVSDAVITVSDLRPQSMKEIFAKVA